MILHFLNYVYDNDSTGKSTIRSQFASLKSKNQIDKLIYRKPDVSLWLKSLPDLALRMHVESLCRAL